MKCHVCGEQFEMISTIKRHYRENHPNMKPFACNMCGKRFNRKENLSRHIRIHTGDRRYVCKYCGKGYTDPSGLKKHIMARHSNTSYTCSLCSNATFTTKESLKRHVARHADKSPQVHQVTQLSVCSSDSVDNLSSQLEGMKNDDATPFNVAHRYQELRSSEETLQLLTDPMKNVTQHEGLTEIVIIAKDGQEQACHSPALEQSGEGLGNNVLPDNN